jgi:predicted phosphate transport protein (TIGR00153 family)
VPFWLPRDQNFFDLFERTTSTIVEGARYLETLVKEPHDLDVRLIRLKELEHEADVTTHETFERLNKTFLTPFDREDLHALASQLDDILDWLEETGQRFGIYKIDHPREDAGRLAHVASEATEELLATIKLLRSHHKSAEAIRKHLVEINRLENEGDQIYRQALSHLFDENGLQTIQVLKWKEIYDALESSIDACEHAAHVIDSILVKYT